MLFNGTDLSPYFRIKNIYGRGLINRRVNAITAPGMDGEYMESVETPAKELEVEVRITGDDLRTTIDELSGILATDEPVPIVFPDEPDKTYYGTVEQSSEDGERIHLNRHDATFIIRRSDPYKYGPEQSVNFSSDTAIVNNPGTAEAKPVIELTAKEPVTFAMVSNGEEYNLVGTPADENIEVIDAKPLMFGERGETLNQWNVGNRSNIDPYPVITNVGGSFGYDGTGIFVEDYSTEPGMRGPTIIKELPETIQDFEVEVMFDLISNSVHDTYRMEFYLFDENMNSLGKMGISDYNRWYSRLNGFGRIGEFVGLSQNYLIGESDYSTGYESSRKTKMMYLRMRREQEVFNFYISEVRNGKHVSDMTIEREYVDNEELYKGKLRYIQIFVGSSSYTETPERSRINYINVYKMLQQSINQTPYIFYSGDLIELDHKERSILVNGEDRSDLKQIGSDFFKLKKGENTLAVLPDGAFDGTVKIRPTYR